MLSDFNDILILINMGQKLKTNAQYIFYLHIFHQRLPNMVKRLFANTLVEPFFKCLFTFTMECGAYLNNAMSSRSSFTK
jgi:hypothetical protein